MQVIENTSSVMYMFTVFFALTSLDHILEWKSSDLGNMSLGINCIGKNCWLGLHIILMEVALCSQKFHQLDSLKMPLADNDLRGLVLDNV